MGATKVGLLAVGMISCVGAFTFYSLKADDALAQTLVEEQKMTLKDTSHTGYLTRIFTFSKNQCDGPDDAGKGHMEFTATKEDGTDVTGVICRQDFWKSQSPYIKIDPPKPAQ